MLVVPVVQDGREDVDVAGVRNGCEEVPGDASGIRYPVRRIWLGLQAELDRALHEAGFDDLRPALGAVFQAMAPDGSRITQMAEQTHMTPQARGQLVTDLQRLGYVDRIPDPSDGRAKLVVLTDRGWQSVGVARVVLTEMEAAWRKRLGDERMDELRSALETIAEILDERAEALPEPTREGNTTKTGTTSRPR